MKRRGIIHFHSSYSYDSLTSPEKILQFALRESLDFLLLTDHDTIKGSVKLRELALSLGVNIEVPIAAEYKLECGDVIAAFIETEIRSRNLTDFIKEVKSQSGLVLLPHPYHHHSRIEEIAESADLIEVFNSRQSSAQDEQALALAGQKHKRVYYASDAHLLRNLRNVIVEFDGGEDLKESLLNATMHPLSLRKSSAFDLRMSEGIKHFRQQNWIRLIGLPLLLTADLFGSRDKWNKS